MIRMNLKNIFVSIRIKISWKNSSSNVNRSHLVVLAFQIISTFLIFLGIVRIFFKWICVIYITEKHNKDVLLWKKSIDNSHTWPSITDLSFIPPNLTPVPLTKIILIDIISLFSLPLPDLKKPLLTKSQKKAKCFLAREAQTANQLKSQCPPARVRCQSVTDQLTGPWLPSPLLVNKFLLNAEFPEWEQSHRIQAVPLMSLHTI